MTKTTDPTLTIEFQRKVSDFVQHEVVYCVSHLVSELVPAILNGDIGQDCPSYEDDAYKLTGKHVWCPVNTKSYNELDEFTDEDDAREALEEWLEDPECAEVGDNNEDDWCIEERHNEALEHWIVSDYLADRLEEHGEIIVRDFFGLTIWGRCCSGQAISIDGVIQRIYEEIHS
jgi:hypothetical protein